MTLSGWVWGLLARSTSAEQQQRQLEAPTSFCSSTFPSLWSQFTEAIADVGFAERACATPEQAGVTTPLPTVLPPAERVVAIGDLHGDLGKTRRVFRSAGLTDDKDQWIGGKTVCVQVGDVLDRGDAEIRILLFLEALQAQARAAGGALHLLNGNHETMNVMGNHRYATPGATTEIVRWNQWRRLAGQLQAHCASCNTPSTSSAAAKGSQRAYQLQQPPAGLAAAEAQGMFGAGHFVRTFAMQPGSGLARRFFAHHPTVLQVGSTVFVHGGVLPEHVAYGLDRINRETSEWMRGGASAPPPSPLSGAGGGGTQAPPPSSSSSSTAASTTSSPSTSTSTSLPPPPHHTALEAPVVPSTRTPPPAPAFLRGADAVVWARNYSAEDAERCECDTLQRVLSAMPGASRMVMGHTIQRAGVNAACDGAALRVDVGLSWGCGNRSVQALEILNDGKTVRRLREGAPPEDISREVAQAQAAANKRADQAPAQLPGGSVVPASAPRRALVSG